VTEGNCLLQPNLSQLNRPTSASQLRDGDYLQRITTMTENPERSATQHEHIPEILKPPKGSRLLLQAYGRGFQRYHCPVKAAVPHAILFTGDGDEGDLVAIHFEGPTWQSSDGSFVVGDAQNATHFTAPDPDGVDWLKVPTKLIGGTPGGQFANVTHVLRLHTDGGKPPPQGCEDNQTEVMVEYSARYLFFHAPSH
jgi:hypothetical protein